MENLPMPGGFLMPVVPTPLNRLPSPPELQRSRSDISLWTLATQKLFRLNFLRRARMKNVRNTTTRSNSTLITNF